MTKTLRVTDPKELLALVPFQLGFAPSDSVVVVSLRGPRKQVGLIARVDVEALESEERTDILHRMMIHCSQDGASRVVLIGYGAGPHPTGPIVDDGLAAAQVPFGRGRELTLESLHKALRATRKAMSQVFPVDEVLAVWDGKCGHFSASGRCCPTLIAPSLDNERTNVLPPEFCWEHTAPIEQLKSTRVAAHLVYKGAVAGTERAALGHVEQASAHRKAAVEEAIKQYLQPSESRFSPANSSWHEDQFDFWNKCIATKDESQRRGTSRPHGPSTIAALAVALKDVTVRDAVLVGCTSQGKAGGLELIRCVIAKEPQRDRADRIAKRAIAEIADPAHSTKPDNARLATVREVLTSIISDSPGDYHSAPRTLLSLIAWWEGNGALARRHLEELESIDGDYSLAKLVTMALDYGLAPGWIRKKNITG